MNCFTILVFLIDNKKVKFGMIPLIVIKNRNLFIIVKELSKSSDYRARGEFAQSCGMRGGGPLEHLAIRC